MTANGNKKPFFQRLSYNQTLKFLDEQINYYINNYEIEDLSIMLDEMYSFLNKLEYAFSENYFESPEQEDIFHGMYDAYTKKLSELGINKINRFDEE